MPAATPTPGVTNPSGVAYIVDRAVQLGLDPFAVIADAEGEGLSGGIGDNGHAFGPFQLNDAGGQFPSTINGVSTSGWSQQLKQEWAWSTQGIDYALQRASGVAGGLKGQAAIVALVNWENPQNHQAAIATRSSYLSQLMQETGGVISKIWSVVTSGGPFTTPGQPGSPQVPNQPSGGSSNCISSVDVLGVHIPYPDLGCIASTIVSPFVAVFNTIEGFFTNLPKYLVRGGLLLGGVILVIVGFGLTAKGGLASAGGAG